MLPVTLQFIVAMIAYAINERMAVSTCADRPTHCQSGPDIKQSCLIAIVPHAAPKC